MASQGDIAKFKARVSQLQRRRFQVVQYSEDPPRAKLRGRMDDDRTRRKNAGLARFSVQGADWEIREVWIDEAGELHDEEIDPSGGTVVDASAPHADADAAVVVTDGAALTQEPVAPASAASESTQKAPRRKATAKSTE